MTIATIFLGILLSSNLIEGAAEINTSGQSGAGKALPFFVDDHRSNRGRGDQHNNERHDHDRDERHDNDRHDHDDDDEWYDDEDNHHEHDRDRDHHDDDHDHHRH